MSVPGVSLAGIAPKNVQARIVLVKGHYYVDEQEVPFNFNHPMTYTFVGQRAFVVDGAFLFLVPHPDEVPGRAVAFKQWTYLHVTACDTLNIQWNLSCHLSEGCPGTCSPTCPTALKYTFENSMYMPTYSELVGNPWRPKAPTIHKFAYLLDRMNHA